VNLTRGMALPSRVEDCEFESPNTR